MREVEQTNANTITVYVKKSWDEGTSSYTLPVDSRVGDALEMAGYSTDAECRVWGRFAEPQWFLDDGDLIIVSTWKVTQG